MQTTTRRLALIAALAALGAGVAAPAHAAVPGIVTANQADSMKYTANTSDKNVVFVTQQGNQLTVNDVVPLKAGAGCAPVAGDPTQATCVVPLNKRFKIATLSGDDSITNATSLGMEANGGIGEDSLFGGVASDILEGGPDADRLRGDDGNDQLVGDDGSDSIDGSGGADALFGGADADILRGGSGDSDYLDGGAGPDTLNGGAGEHDLVNYDLRPNDVFVTLPQPNTATSAGNGPQGENDQITQIEDVRGGKADDILVGNERDNRLEAYVGNRSIMIGGAGADFLAGGSGEDTLDAGGGLFSFVDDGAVDRLFGLDGTDSCTFSTLDKDLAFECE